MGVRWRGYAKDVILKRIAFIEAFSEREGRGRASG
jgi:hypothetical protein